MYTKDEGEKMKYGYVRISEFEPTQEKQLEGVDLDQKIIEHATAKQFRNEVLKDLLDDLKEGDELHVHSIDRLVVSITGLNRVISRLIDQGVSIHFHREGFVFNGDKDDKIQQLQLETIQKLSQFSRNVTGERQREGMAQAKLEGKQIGRKRVLTDEQAKELKSRANLGGETKTELAKAFGISRKTLYVYLKK
jgi:DNA invertase Pin-like site-specific DNA recombinase